MMSAIVFNTEMAKANDEGLRHFVPSYPVFQQLIALVLDAELKKDDASILVTDAGGGAELMALAPTRETWRLTGVDPSADMLALAKGKLRQAGFAVVEPFFQALHMHGWIARA